MMGSYTVGDPKRGGIRVGNEDEISFLDVYATNQTGVGIDRISFTATLGLKNGGRHYLDDRQFSELCDTCQIARVALARITAARMLDSWGKNTHDMVTVRADEVL